jgi:hypothetical protein
MADFVVVKTTNESGAVEQEIVSVNQTELDVTDRSLVENNEVGPLLHLLVSP